MVCVTFIACQILILCCCRQLNGYLCSRWSVCVLLRMILIMCVTLIVFRVDCVVLSSDWRSIYALVVCVFNFEDIILTVYVTSIVCESCVCVCMFCSRQFQCSSLTFRLFVLVLLSCVWVHEFLLCLEFVYACCCREFEGDALAKGYSKSSTRGLVVNQKICWIAFCWQRILPHFVRCNQIITKLIWSKHSKKLFASLSTAPPTLMCLCKQSKLLWCAWTMWSWPFSHIGTSEGDSMFAWSPSSLSLCGWKVAPYLSK